MNRYSNRFPDFLISLIPPILTFAALDALFGTRYFTQPYWPTYYYFLIFGGAVAAEQVMTVLSGWLLRGFVLGLVLRYPSRNLFEHDARGFLGMIFPEYFASFPTEMAARLKAKFEREGVKGLEAQYLHACTRIQGRVDIQARIDSLLAQSYFAQNFCFGSLLVFFVSCLATHNLPMLAFAFVTTFLSFYRFLRVVRAHAMELYLAYDYLTADERTEKGARQLHAA